MNPQYGTHKTTDCLYRISLKCLITNDQGDILVVKEQGRNYWDLPGGGMDYGENIKSAMARELKEEVNFEGNFTYEILEIDEPEKFTTRDIWQVRIILKITPGNLTFSTAVDSDEVAFMKPVLFKDSAFLDEAKIYQYASIVR